MNWIELVKDKITYSSDLTIRRITWLGLLVVCTTFWGGIYAGWLMMDKRQQVPTTEVIIEKVVPTHSDEWIDKNREDVGSLKKRLADLKTENAFLKKQLQAANHEANRPIVMSEKAIVGSDKNIAKEAQELFGVTLKLQGEPR